MQCVCVVLLRPFCMRVCELHYLPLHNANGGYAAMLQHLHVFSHFLFCRRRQIILAFSCFSGNAFGLWVSGYSQETYFLLTRMAPSLHVSVPGLVACVYLPFLFAAFAVFLSHPSLLPLICFYKMFLFSWCGCSMVSTFGSAGWLVQMLVQFSDNLSLPMLCWFCVRHVDGRVESVTRDFLICTLWVLIVGITDLCVVSPFLASLIYQ